MKARFLAWFGVMSIFASGCAGGKAIAYFNLGTACMEKHDWNTAIDHFTKAIEINPRDAEAYNARGLAYAMTGVRFDEAIDDYNKAIEIDPTYAEAYNNRGTVYGRKDDDDRAVQDYTKALEINPMYANAYNNRAVVYDRKGDYDRAIGDYRSSCERGGEAACKTLREWATRSEKWLKR